MSWERTTVTGGFHSRAGYIIDSRTSLETDIWCVIKVNMRQKKSTAMITLQPPKKLGKHAMLAAIYDTSKVARWSWPLVLWLTQIQATTQRLQLMWTARVRSNLLAIIKISSTHIYLLHKPIKTGVSSASGVIWTHCIFADTCAWAEKGLAEKALRPQAHVFSPSTAFLHHVSFCTYHQDIFPYFP